MKVLYDTLTIVSLDNGFVLTLNQQYDPNCGNPSNASIPQRTKVRQLVFKDMKNLLDCIASNLKDGTLDFDGRLEEETIK